ncbi:MAG: ASKHA domain-containing protein [Angelakisella sp.]|nr:ASKHA domain-containing protein [Angelakisella sp.]
MTDCNITIEQKTFSATLGARLSDVFVAYAPNLSHLPDMPCAGMGRCGKCRIIAQGALSPLSQAELCHLTQEEVAAGWRLACCCTVLGDCTITLPKTEKSQIQGAGIMPDFDPDPVFGEYGIAVDIGTTTLAAQLYGKDGLLAQAAAPNPQASYGADVISRIEQAMSDSGKAEALADCIRRGVSALIQELCVKPNIPTEAVDALVITGNTAMLYLLTRHDPTCLAAAPFAADRLFGENIPAATLQLPCPKAMVYLPPCISAFVGGDITTALLASDLCSHPDTALLADIGTNGEIALWHQNQLLCCSTAAGPAFEGAGLSMGMGGKTGAIDHVKIDPQTGTLQAHILGDTAPRGICGSGVIDALACLLQTEQMDSTGFLKDGSTVISDPVVLTQQDVRMVQLAKSAIYAGISTLVQQAGLTHHQIQTFYIAGGFGSYLDITNAAFIGLFPPQLQQAATVLGNASLCGAAMLLLQKDAAKQAHHIARHAKTIDLSTSSIFMDAYTNGMFFE